MRAQSIRNALPTRRDVWLSGVLPTAAALLVAALLLVERLQTDLSLADKSYFLGVWVAVPIAFGLAHIWGISPVADETLTVWVKAARLAKGAGFLAANAKGFPVGVSFLVLPLLMIGGFDGPPQPYEQSILFKALVAWPLTAWLFLSPGVCFGVLLALAAAPRWRSLARADWKRLLFAYAAGGALATLALVQMNERVVSYYIRGDYNPLFNADRAWPVAIIAYSIVILACAVIWMAALQAYARSGNVLKSREPWLGLGSLAIFALLLAAATHVAAAHRVILLGDNVDTSNPVANYVRSNRPTLSPRSLKVDGGYFTGPRSVLKGRGNFLTLKTSNWQPRPRGDNLFLIDEIEVRRPYKRAERPPDCRQLSATRTVCADLARANAKMHGGRADIEALEYDSSIPEAAVPLRFSGPDNAPATVDALRTGDEGQRCSVNLSGVPFEGLETHAWILCGDTWPAEARRLKTMLATWFSKNAR